MKGREVVLVTGASCGLGRAIAELLARSGYSVFGTSRRAGGLRDLPFEMLDLDVDSAVSTRSCMDALLRRAGRIDVLINNAGFGLFGAVEETSIAEAKAQFETNFFGAVRMVKATLPVMRREGGGEIINIGSASTLIPFPFQAFYVASKAALHAYTEALRYEVARFKIKVFLVEPAYFRTEFAGRTESASRPVEVYDDIRGHVRAVHQERIERGRDPSEVASAVLRLMTGGSAGTNAYVPEGQERKVLELQEANGMGEYARRFWRLDSSPRPRSEVVRSPGRPRPRRERARNLSASGRLDGSTDRRDRPG